MADRYWVGGTNTWNATAGTKWALTSGGAGGEAVPTIDDDVYIDSGSGVVTVTVGAASNCKSLNFISGAGSFAGTFAGTSAINCALNLVLSASMTLTYTGTITFNGTSGTGAITTNGKTVNSNLTFNGVGGSWALQDALTTNSGRSIILTNGTLNLNNNTFTLGFFSSTNSNTRTLAFGTGQMTILGNNTTIFSLATATNLTVTGTPTVNATYSGATGTRTINGGGATTYSASNPKIIFNITAGTDVVSLGGGNVFGNVNFTGFTGSYAFTATDPQFFGDLTFGTGMTGPSSATRSLRLMGTSGTQTITSNGVTINSGITCEGGGTYSFADALTQGATNTFAFTFGTVKLKNGVTSTVGVFSASGTTQKYLQSTLAGSQATLSQASGTVSVSSLTIQDINATGGASWNAYVDFDNDDAGNNDGWNFGLSPPYATYEPPIIIRSFTQPRRF
jgi:hypothetical protein